MKVVFFMIQIRKESAADYTAVYDLILRAFQGAEHSDGTEQDLVVRLRKSTAFIPSLSLVAVEDHTIVGHLLFSKIELDGLPALSLAPLAVLPERQKQGIGTLLIQEGHRIARELGYQWSIVLGSEQYYPRLGYQPASQFGIRAPFGVPDENFMALHLFSSPSPVNATVTYAKEFFE